MPCIKLLRTLALSNALYMVLFREGQKEMLPTGLAHMCLKEVLSGRSPLPDLWLVIKERLLFAANHQVFLTSKGSRCEVARLPDMWL